MKENLRTFLAAQGGITAITTNIFAPSDQDATGAYVTFEQTGQTDDKDLDGVIGHRTYEVTVSAHSGPLTDGTSGTALAADNLADAIEAALSGYSGAMGAFTNVQVSLIDRADDYDDEAQTATVELDFSIMV